MSNRHVIGSRALLPLVVGALLAAAAITSVVALAARFDRSQEARTRLAYLDRDLDYLQTIPWTVLGADSPSPGAVAARLAATEKQIRHSLTDLQRHAAVGQLRGASAALAANFIIDEQIRRTARNPRAATGELVAEQNRTRHAVETLLGRAATEYEANANHAHVELISVTVAAIVALLSAFAFFYWSGVQRRRAAESLAAELKKSEAHLEEAQRLVHLGSWEWDSARGVLRCSPECARLHGWMPSEPPHNLEDLLGAVNSEDRARVLGAIADVLRDSGSASLDYRIEDGGEGRLVRLELTTTDGADGSAADLLIGTAQDVTDRIRLLEARRANEAKNQFISRMSHELRTPLNAILGFGQLLGMSSLDERQSAHVKHILSAGKHLLDLINEILDISRIETGALRVSPEAVSVDCIVEEAVELVSPMAIKRGIRVSVGYADEKIWARADVQRLKQVLLNLLANAVKYNRDGGHVWVRMFHRDDQAQIAVMDDGAGISPAMIARLFQPFDRLGAEDSNVEGTGLGLALSKRMIEAMGGAIRVDSELGRGSTFTVELAVAEAPTETVDWTRHPVREGLTSGGSPKLLCIEDNPSNLALIERIVGMRPHIELLTATNAAQGIELAHKHLPDLVFLDVNLPDVPGPEVLARFKADPRLARVPIVIVSADATPSRIEGLLAHGAHAYLPKPIDIPEILRTIDELIVQPREAAA